MKRIAPVVAIACVAAGLILATLAAASTAQQSATTVQVTLGPGWEPKYFRVLPRVAKAGPVTFVVSNRTNLPFKSYGVDQTVPARMQFVVLRTNLAPDKLGILKSGTTRKVVLTSLVGKSVPILPGKRSEVTLNLKPGKYVLLDPKTYEYGMRAPFTVVG